MTDNLNGWELEQEWNELVEGGQQDLLDRDNKTWSVGYKACRVAARWDRKKSLLKYAKAIGMGRPKQIYEWHMTAEEFPESAVAEIQQECPRITWSHFREAAREAERRRKRQESVTPADLKSWLIQAEDNELDANEFGVYLKTGLPAYIVKYASFEANGLRVQDDGTVIMCIPPEKVVELVGKRGNRNFTVRISTSWEEEAVK